jgi:hypothetical protein
LVLTQIIPPISAKTAIIIRNVFIKFIFFV